MNSLNTFQKIIAGSMLMYLAFIFSGCGAVNRNISVPIEADVGQMSVYKRMPVKAAVLISEGNRYYVYKGTPSSFEFSNLEHVFPIGKALERLSLQIFSPYFREVKLIRVPEVGGDFRVVIEPQVEDFSFRYDITSMATSSTQMITASVSMKLGLALYVDGKKIWYKSTLAPVQRQAAMYVINSTYETQAGRAVSQALLSCFAQMGQELLFTPAVDDALAGIAGASKE